VSPRRAPSPAAAPAAPAGTPAAGPAAGPTAPHLEAGNTLSGALLLLGDQWTLLVLQRAFLGARRFQDWQQALPISTASLSDRLRQLVEFGLLAKTAAGARQQYLLTESGRGTWTVFVAIWRWEQAWLPRPRTQRAALVHDACGGQDITTQLRCATCGLPAPLDTVTVTPLAERHRVERSFVPRRHRQRRSGRPHPDVMSFQAETMEILGDRWNIPLLAVALLGVSRFAEFQRALGIPPSVLSARLARLAELGVLTTRPLGAGDQRRDYHLSGKGRSFFDVLVLLSDWGDRHLAPAGARTLVVVHAPCAQPLRPLLTCGECEVALRRTEVHFEAPGGW
jgi:DNA-binding HxlR family transcriptional regulator